MSKIEMISMDDVIYIHERLVVDAQESDDPISPPGVKDHGLLESAISRQHAGYDGQLKYDDPIANAATLCYGICCNHALHNGNKRTALVSMLCHLDKNGYTFNNRTNQQDLYSFMINVARHSLVNKKKLKKTTDISDLEVTAMTQWISKRSRRIEKGERTLSYSDLEKLLRQHDIYFENHKNNYVDVIKYSTQKQRTSWFTSKEIQISEKIANIPYWPGRTVGKGLIKSIRQKAKLTADDGFDSALFYGTETTPDDFVQKYKKVLRMLAKT